MALAESELIISSFQLKCLAESLTTDRQRETLADIILSSNGAFKKSEGIRRETTSGKFRSDTQAAKREVAMSQLEYVEWIRAKLTDNDISQILEEAAQANLTPKQRKVWVFYQSGLSQEKIAKVLNVSHPTICRMLQAIRQKLHHYVWANQGIHYAYIQDVHRGKKQYVTTGEPLPRWIQEARQVIEDEPGITTHINPEHPRCVEIRKNGEAIEIVPFRELKARSQLTTIEVTKTAVKST